MLLAKSIALVLMFMAVYLFLHLRNRHWMPAFRWYLWVPIVSGAIYLYTPGNAWPGWWALVPKLAELAVAIEAIAWMAPLVSDVERSRVVAGASLFGIGIAILVSMTDSPGYAFWSWYPQIVLHAWETGTLFVISGYVWGKHGLNLGHSGRVILCHGMLLTAYFGVDLASIVGPRESWFQASSVVLGVHLMCVLGWLWTTRIYHPQRHAYV